MFPPWTVALARIVGWMRPTLRDGIAVLRWLRKVGSVSRATEKQRVFFDEVPTIDDSVARCCRDNGL